MNMCLLVVASSSACSFLCHACYLVYFVKDWERLEVIENLMASGTYAFVGVCLPCWAMGVLEHQSLKELWTLSTPRDPMGGTSDQNPDSDESVHLPFLQSRSGDMPQHELRYQIPTDESEGFGHSNFLLVSHLVLPIIVVIGSMAPILVWAPEVDAIGEDMVFKVMTLSESGNSVAFLFLCWTWGTLFFGAGKLEEEGLSVVHKMLDKYISSIQRGTLKNMAHDVRKVDQVLTDFFSWSVTGRLWIARLAVLFGTCLIASGISVSHPRSTMRMGCLVAAVISGLFGTLLLSRLSLVTQKCCGTDPDAKSLWGALHAEMGSNEPEDGTEKFYFQVLQQYLAKRSIGVRLSGLLVTIELVVFTALRACVYLPLAAEAVGMHLHGSNSSATEA